MLTALISQRSTGKTTSCANLGLAATARKLPVFGYDCDQAGHWFEWWLTARAERRPFPYPVVTGATKHFGPSTLHVNPHDGLIGLADVGHLEDHQDVARAVLAHADHAVLTMPPNLNDLERYESGRVAELLDEVDADRQGRGLPKLLRMLLLVKVKAGPDAGEFADEMATRGWTNLDTRIPDTVNLARKSGDSPPTSRDVRRYRYDDLVSELISKGVWPDGR